MLNTIFGIPAHPLLVHAAVVFIPLLVLGAIAYAALPGLHSRFTWAAAALAVIAPVSALLAKFSGENLRNQRFAGQNIPLLLQHNAYANDTVLWTVGLGILTLLLIAYVVTGRRRGTGRYGKGQRGGLEYAAATVIMVVVGGFTAYYVFRTGDTGAHMVWG